MHVCVFLSPLSYTLRYLRTSLGRYSLSNRKWSPTMLSVRREHQWEVGWSDVGPPPAPSPAVGLESRRFFCWASSFGLCAITESLPSDTMTQCFCIYIDKIRILHVFKVTGYYKSVQREVTNINNKKGLKIYERMNSSSIFEQDLSVRVMLHFKVVTVNSSPRP